MANENIEDIKVKYIENGKEKIVRLGELPETAPAFFVYYLPGTDEHSSPYQPKNQIVERVRKIIEEKTQLGKPLEGMLTIKRFGIEK